MENGIKVNLPNMENAIKKMNSATNPVVQNVGNAKTESVDIATFTPKEVSVSGGSAIQYKVPESESNKQAENFWNTTFLPWANEVGSTTLQAIKKTGATVGTVGISLVEGVGKFGESLVDAGVILETGVNSITTGLTDGVQAINGLITGKEWTSMTKSMWNNTMDFVKTDYVGDTFDKFYENTKAGHALKENTAGFDVARGLGSAVGEIGGLIALTVFTAGIGTAATGASAAAAGASGASTAASSAATAASSMSKIMAGINAASGLGRGASKAWNEGANCVEGLGYGTMLGAWNAAQVGVGMKIQGLKWPFPKEMSGKAVTKVLNSTSRVILDGIDNGLEAFTQPLFEKVYKEEDYQTLFEEAGGWSNFGTQFAAGSFFSAASEVGVFNKILTKNATDTTVSHSTLKIGDSSYEMSDAMYTSILDSMEKSNLAQNLDLSGGTIKIKDNLDPKVKCETLYNLLERSSAFIGQGALDDDVLMQKWNEGVGRSLSSKGNLIKFLMENQKYDRADKVMTDLLTDLYDFRKNVTVSPIKPTDLSQDAIKEDLELAFFDRKESFINKIKNSSSAIKNESLTVEQINYINQVNNLLKTNDYVNIKLNNTSQITPSMLNSIDDLSRVNVIIDGSFRDIDGNLKVKYNKDKYLQRMTYTASETLSIVNKLDYLQSMIDMSLPTKERAYQIYQVLANEIPVMRDFNYYVDGHKVAASFRGLTANNSVGKEGLVCAGYASVFKELCNRCGIKCDYIRGKAILDPLTGQSGAHAWNIIIDDNGEIIPVDVTWKASGGDEWFGKSEAFSSTHIADADEYFKDYKPEVYAQWTSNSNSVIESIVNTMDQKYGQGVGISSLENYLNTGDKNTITRTNNARAMLDQVGVDDINNYLLKNSPSFRNNQLSQIEYIMDQKYGYGQGRASLIEYVNFGDANVITRTDNARNKIQAIPIHDIINYLKGGF